MTETPQKTRKAIFHTNTDISPLSWELMGISAKANDECIGMFGTGLKYAIAVIPRTGGKITIKNCDKTYEFASENIKFRGKDFDQITCNGKALPFTTEYGKGWELWQAYRELYSNTSDEDGLHFIGEPMDDGTSIIVEDGAFVKCMENHADYFIHDREPIAKCDGMKIYDGKGTVYYRGVRVGVMELASYSFELNYITLTEDRSIKYEFSVRTDIGMYVSEKIKDKAILRQFAMAGEGTFEHDIPMDHNWSDEFMEVVEDIWLKSPTKLTKPLQRLRKKRRPETEWEIVPATEDQQMVIDRGVELLKKFGYSVTAPIKIVNNDDDNVIAYVHQNMIYLTERIFDRGMFFFLTTLLEEHLHTVGYDDYSRGLQNYLLEQVIMHSSKRFKEPI